MPNLPRGLRAAFLISPMFLAACSSIPAYHPAPEEAQAKVTLLGWGTPYLCKGGKMFSLPIKQDGPLRTTSVPAGERIGLVNYISISGYQVVSTCISRASVIPRKGVDLIVNGVLADAGKCGMEIVREDTSKDTGVAIEPSFAGPSC